jgi:hypothetical protein
MHQKETENLGISLMSHDQSKVNSNKIDSLDYYRNHGIPSEDITHEKIGQTTLVFTNRIKKTVEDYSLEASIKYLKFKRFNP